MTVRIGLLGDGQLAQMTCLAGRELGYEMHVYASAPDQPACATADRVWVGDLRDEARLADFAQAVDAVAYDTELLPFESVRAVARHARACPGPQALFIAQNRIREREFLQSAGIPMPRLAIVQNERELHAAIAAVGTPSVLKTAEQGYDGKGQVKLERAADALAAWESLGRVPCVLEEWIAYERECSVIVAGDAHGHLRAFDPTDNEHRRHILHRSISPSSLPARTRALATDTALAIARKLELVGLLAVELFHTADGRILVNELAPRPHNSGHHTQRSANVSQFAQLCLAAAGERVVAPEERPAVMINLLGDLFVSEVAGEAVYRQAGFQPEREPGVSVYFYGKQEARPGRKMGHIIAVGETVGEACARAEAAYARYSRTR